MLSGLRDVVVGDRFLRRLDEALEQRAELAGAEEILRVPLDAEAEERRRILDRFDDARPAPSPTRLKPLATSLTA